MPGLSRRPPLHRRRRPAEIPDRLRIRACRRVGNAGMEQGPRQQSVERPHPPLHAPRCRVARRLPPPLAEIAPHRTSAMALSNTDPCFLPAHVLAAEIGARRLSPIEFVAA